MPKHQEDNGPNSALSSSQQSEKCGYRQAFCTCHVLRTSQWAALSPTGDILVVRMPEFALFWPMCRVNSWYLTCCISSDILLSG